MTTRKLLIASPAKSGLPVTFPLFWNDVMTKGIPGWEINYAVESSQNALSLSRNILAHQALATGMDRLIMMDLDHPIGRHHLERLLSHDHEEVPIVSALYCMKKPGNPFFLGIRAKGAQVRGDGLLEARFLPTGLLSISTKALRAIAAKHPEREYYVQDEECFPAALVPTPKETKKTMFEFFPIGVNGPRTAAARLNAIKRIVASVTDGGGPETCLRPDLENAIRQVDQAIYAEQKPGYMTGEDYHFSLLAYQAGISQFLDVKLMIPHRGSIDYPILDPKVVATACDPIPEHESDIDTW